MHEKILNFVEYLRTQVRNHGIYVLGAQGEDFLKITPEWLEDHESYNQIARIYQKLANDYADKVDFSKAKCFDCSGLGVYYFLQMGYLKHDMTADGLYNICVPIQKSELRAGDCTFQVTSSTGVMHHIGYMTSMNSLIESKGRAYGVVESKLNQSWSHFGRPWFFCETTFKRELSVGSNGKDVELLQATLNAKGYPCGRVDGSYGKKTSTAVANFQKKENVGVLQKNLGKAGKKTIVALGLNWETK